MTNNDKTFCGAAIGVDLLDNPGLVGSDSISSRTAL